MTSTLWVDKLHDWAAAQDLVPIFAYELWSEGGMSMGVNVGDLVASFESSSASHAEAMEGVCERFFTKFRDIILT